VGVSIYYTATRPRPLSIVERSTIDWHIAQFPVEALIRACGAVEDEFNGEPFCVYSADDDTEPNVVLEGATKLPGFSDDASWIAIQYWCRLLAEIRRVLHDAEWHVHVEDHDLKWNDRQQAYDLS
jgi:hypothetical protein